MNAVHIEYSPHLALFARQGMRTNHNKLLYNVLTVAPIYPLIHDFSGPQIFFFFHSFANSDFFGTSRTGGLFGGRLTIDIDAGLNRTDTKLVWYINRIAGLV